MKVVNEYLDYLVSEGRSEKTIKPYRAALNEMIEYMNYKSIDDVNKTSFIDLRTNWIIKKKNEGLSNQSLNQRVAACKGFFSYLTGRRLIDYNYARELKSFPVEQKSKIADLDDIKAIRNHLKNRYSKKPSFNNLRDMFIVDILLSTGLRNTELRKLNIDSIDATSGEFTVIQKRNTSKECILNEDTLKLYREYLKERNTIESKDNALIISSYKTRISAKGLEKIIEKICKEMGLEHITPHTFRHYCGSSLIENGVPIEAVAKILGHSNSQMTYSWYYQQSNRVKKDIVNNNPIFN